jgi:hypothetical protein
VTKGGANTKGVIAATTTAAVGCLGCTLDTATYQAGQNTDNATDQAAYVSVIINPQAVWRAKLSGGATENTRSRFSPARPLPPPAFRSRHRRDRLVQPDNG